MSSVRFVMASCLHPLSDPVGDVDISFQSTCYRPLRIDKASSCHEAVKVTPCDHVTDYFTQRRCGRGRFNAPHQQRIFNLSSECSRRTHGPREGGIQPTFTVSDKPGLPLAPLAFDRKPNRSSREPAFNNFKRIPVKRFAPRNVNFPSTPLKLSICLYLDRRRLVLASKFPGLASWGQRSQERIIESRHLFFQPLSLWEVVGLRQAIEPVLIPVNPLHPFIKLAGPRLTAVVLGF